ncbi:MAG TPA: NAD(P)/FAD-dependent oxidoreductase [Solirubrobacteraceae bacterium]|jgi:cation diffusion facilitator CzcD-associated flavoprotein CzcO|nr:NAD(P)/FAD-dependent oxidoreductase [Solirubrobacteraceae bacterium]
MSARKLEVLIVGAGFGGIAAAIELRRHGISAITILEKAPELGGTWFYNSYPGAACDVPSHLYSFSYAQRRDWSRLCSPQAEIRAYLNDVARAHGVDRLVRTNTTVSSCSWNAEHCRWNVETAGGPSHEADVLIVATGQLDQPSRPRIDGADSFAGHSFHSAEWDHDYPLAGKRVAVIGTGASAVQFVPEIAPAVERLTVFQRTGNWFMPRRNRRYNARVKAAIERIPGLQALRRRFVFEYTESLTLAIRHPRTVGRVAAARSAAFMRSQLKDPAIRAKAWPDYTFGCKRILFSSHYLPALQRANVELVTDAIARITPTGIVTASGAARELDCVIWATGFKTTDFMFPMRVSGGDGVELHEYWSSGAHAHFGMCVPNFPNMFVMYGPNTNTSGGSIIVYLEAQAAYIRQALEQLRDRAAGAIEVRAEVEAASDRALQARFAGTAWTQCDSWYRDENGRIVTNWPGYMREYLEQTARLDAAEYRFVPLPKPATVVSA